MIGYITLGTNDVARATAFYDGLLATVGASRLMPMPKGGHVWGRGWDQPMLAITVPYDEQPATPGNGTMVALQAGSRAEVDAIHAAAIALGAPCEGPPGLRGPDGDSAFYGAYFRDPDGNKLCAFRMGPA